MVDISIHQEGASSITKGKTQPSPSQTVRFAHTPNNGEDRLSSIVPGKPDSGQNPKDIQRVVLRDRNQKPGPSIIAWIGYMPTPCQSAAQPGVKSRTGRLAPAFARIVTPDRKRGVAG